MPPDDSPPDPNRPIENGHDLLWRYRIRWEARHKADWVGEKADHVIARDILERLAELGPEREAKARSLIPAAMDRYLADVGPAAHRHPFKWFDERLAGLIADAQVGTGPASRDAKGADRPCEFHRQRQRDTRGQPAPKAQFRNECPECRHVSARIAPRAAGAPTAIGDLIASAGGVK